MVTNRFDLMQELNVSKYWVRHCKKLRHKRIKEAGHWTYYKRWHGMWCHCFYGRWQVNEKCYNHKVKPEVYREWVDSFKDPRYNVVIIGRTSES